MLQPCNTCISGRSLTTSVQDMRALCPAAFGRHGNVLGHMGCNTALFRFWWWLDLCVPKMGHAVVSVALALDTGDRSLWSEHARLRCGGSDQEDLKHHLNFAKVIPITKRRFVWTSVPVRGVDPIPLCSLSVALSYPLHIHHASLIAIALMAAAQ
ncbi:unnamed protein product [Ostreobium quekettii]|uniref:Uncharacterized protein n=1 Tax=Ostreobium quekettii TaxID=121088 RepID=A0A8S1IRH9_9CHLO|nr:unnamed protein product [Ostreobium quekettii]